MTTEMQKTYGLACIFILTAISYFLASLPFMANLGISSLVIAIVLGILFGNTVTYPESWIPGIQFAAKRLLRAAIVLYGFRISFQQIISVGPHALLIDLLMVGLTLFLGFIAGRKIFKLDSNMSLLISAGAAICGAAAVLAVEEVIKSEPHKAAVAIGTVVLFGTLSMFLYPLLQHSGVLGLTDPQFGIYAGASIHEVAQALVAGSDISSEAGKMAVIVKMIRVLLLVPVLILLSLFYQRSAHQKKRLMVPWFAIGFIVVIGFNSLHLLAPKSISLINQADIILLTMAMGAIGMETKFNKIKKVGLKPLYLASLLFIWLMSSAYLMVKMV